MISHRNWNRLLALGFELRSSGTTGPSRAIFQTPEKLAAANSAAIDAQGLTSNSHVLTVCSMNHAGGVLAQTLPAFSIGAKVTIKPFNAFSFWRDIQGVSHTHLTPDHCRMLMSTRSFSTVNFGRLFVACGSDNVSYDIIEGFVSRNAIFMCNWGMTEIGPIAINTVFDSIDKVHHYKTLQIPGGTLLGDRYFCDYKLKQDELVVRGDICVYDDWFATRDRVVSNKEGALYYLGRL